MYAAVVEPQRLCGVAAIQMEQGEVPPDVEGEGAVRRPVRLPPAQMGDAVGRPPLHFHHVGHGVNRPGIARLHLQGLQTAGFGLRVAALLV